MTNVILNLIDYRSDDQYRWLVVFSSLFVTAIYGALNQHDYLFLENEIDGSLDIESEYRLWLLCTVYSSTCIT